MDGFDIKTYLWDIVSPMLTQPDRANIEVSKTTAGYTRIELVVADKDYGKVVGREGRTIRALETILHTVEWVGNKQRAQYDLRLANADKVNKR